MFKNYNLIPNIKWKIYFVVNIGQMGQNHDNGLDKIISDIYIHCIVCRQINMNNIPAPISWTLD